MGCRIVRTIAMGSRSGGVPGAVLIHRPRTGRDNVGEMRRPLLPIIPQNTCCCGTICQLFLAPCQGSGSQVGEVKARRGEIRKSRASRAGRGWV